MSVKKIALATLALIVVGGFITAGVVSAVNTKNTNQKLEFQSAQLKNKDIELQDLNIEHEQVTKKLNEALKKKNLNQAEIDRLKRKNDAADKEKARLKAELQAKADSKAKVAKVSTNAITASTITTGGGSIKEIIITAAKKYGVSADRALRVASCESTGTPGKFNARIVNYNYSELVNGVRYYPSGLFQHLANYWPSRAAKYGYAGASVFDPVANADVTMAMWRDGASGLWECK